MQEEHKKENFNRNNLSTEKLSSLFDKKEINSGELVDLLNGIKKGLINFTLVDVREELENNTKQIIGMDYLIPTSVFNEGIDRIADLKESNIIVHCHSGARSGRVQQLMLQIGY